MQGHIFILRTILFPIRSGYGAEKERGESAPAVPLGLHVPQIHAPGARDRSNQLPHEPGVSHAAVLGLSPGFRILSR